MSTVSKINTILTEFSSVKTEALCVWIAENCDNIIGWAQLSKESGLTHQELIAVFKIYKHQTPMAYIMNVREQKKKDLPRYPQANLFKMFSKKDKEEE